MGRIFVVGTADTKGEELAYLRAAVAEAGRAPIVVDVGIGPPRCDVDIVQRGRRPSFPLAHFLGSTDRGGLSKCGYQSTSAKGLGGNSGFQCTTRLAFGNCPK